MLHLNLRILHITVAIFSGLVPSLAATQLQNLNHWRRGYPLIRITEPNNNNINAIQGHERPFCGI